MKERSSARWRYLRGSFAITGGVNVGISLTEALKDPRYFIEPKGAAKATAHVIVCLLAPALLESGIKAFRTVFENEPEELKNK